MGPIIGPGRCAPGTRVPAVGERHRLRRRIALSLGRREGKCLCAAVHARRRLRRTYHQRDLEHQLEIAAGTAEVHRRLVGPRLQSGG